GEVPAFHRGGQAVDEAHVGRGAQQLVGAQQPSRADVEIAEHARDEKVRPAHVVAPRQHEMPAVRLAQKLHQLQVEFVAEARHRPGHRAQGVRVHCEIDLVAGGVGIAARIAKHAELDLPAAQAIEKRLGDVAAVIHLSLDYRGTGLTLPAKICVEQGVVPERQARAFHRRPTRRVIASTIARGLARPWPAMSSAAPWPTEENSTGVPMVSAAARLGASSFAATCPWSCSMTTYAS